VQVEDHIQPEQLAEGDDYYFPGGTAFGSQMYVQQWLPRGVPQYLQQAFGQEERPHWQSFGAARINYLNWWALAFVPRTDHVPHYSSDPAAVFKSSRRQNQDRSLVNLRHRGVSSFKYPVC
jgi:hypothetical protein